MRLLLKVELRNAFARFFLLFASYVTGLSLGRSHS